MAVRTLAVSECLPLVSPQRQLGKNIKFGQRPSNAIPMKKAGSADASSEEDFVLTSPMEIVTQQDIVLSDTENKVSLLQGKF